MHRDEDHEPSDGAHRDKESDDCDETEDHPRSLGGLLRHLSGGWMERRDDEGLVTDEMDSWLLGWIVGYLLGCKDSDIYIYISTPRYGRDGVQFLSLSVRIFCNQMDWEVMRWKEKLRPVNEFTFS